jgi:dUTP diphosphatase
VPDLTRLANAIDKMAEGNPLMKQLKAATDRLREYAAEIEALDAVFIRFTDEREISETLHDEGFRPDLVLKTAKQHDIGHDLPLWLPEGDVVLEPGRRLDLPTGLRICLPQTLGARIVSRSSTFFRLGLEVYEGLIDPGYTGELKVMILNRTERPVTVKDGQRLAQVVFFPAIRPRLCAVPEFPKTDRGEDGFGSTGT